MPKTPEYKIIDDQTIEGIYFAKRTYRNVGNYVYYIPGEATTEEKKILNGWTKNNRNRGTPPPPWKFGCKSMYSGICADELTNEDDDENVVLDDVPSIDDLTDEQIRNITAETAEVPQKPIIYNIKELKDNRFRQGYREYPRL